MMVTLSLFGAQEASQANRKQLLGGVEIQRGSSEVCLLRGNSAASAFNSEGNRAGSALTHRSRGQMTDPSPLITADRQGTLSGLTYGRAAANHMLRVYLSGIS